MQEYAMDEVEKMIQEEIDRMGPSSQNLLDEMNESRCEEASVERTRWNELDRLRILIEYEQKHIDNLEMFLRYGEQTWREYRHCMGEEENGVRKNGRI